LWNILLYFFFLICFCCYYILRSMSIADCFIVLPEESSGVEAGEWVEVEPFL